MITIPAHADIYVLPAYIEPRQGIDFYMAQCNRYQLDPRSGDLFVFRDEEAIMIGVLRYDGNGYQWCLKRFSQGTLTGWPKAATEAGVVKISSRELEIMWINNT